jgi:hypothetical protein
MPADNVAAIGAGETPCRSTSPATRSPNTAIDVALQDLRGQVLQAAVIVNLATKAIRDSGSHDSVTTAWTSLTAVHALMSKIADRLQSSETVLLGYAPRGEY